VTLVGVATPVLARYYDPATAQFLTVDPDVATTLSPYGYVAGDPLNASDPGGLTNDASSGSGGYYTSGPEAGCEVNFGGGPALCSIGGGQVAPMGSGVPGASWATFLLGAAAVLTVGAVAEAIAPEILASEAGATTTATATRLMVAALVFTIASVVYRSVAYPGQSADEFPEGQGTLHVPGPTPTPTPTPTPMMCPAHPYTGPYDGPVT
jgi:uncharacterized protein RhaS with RHS repeats